MDSTFFLHAALIAVMATLTHGEFSPNLTISSCKNRRAVIHVEDAAPGGLLFIQGGGSDCLRTTELQLTEHTFMFEQCNIEYDMKFRVVVQQNPRYQTGNDKVIPIMCLVDTSDLHVSNIIYPAESNDKSMNKTVRPTVSMRIVASDDVISGEPISEVSIDDELKLLLSLDEPYLHDFDIKAKDCIASKLPLVKNECSSDQDLFPNFSKGQRGSLTSAFHAFTPTNLLGAAEVDVAFTCNVTVCKGECIQKVCGEIVGWGRKRRQNDETDNEYEKVTVAAKIRVKARDPDMQAHGFRGEQEYLCGSKLLVSAVLGVAVVSLIFSWLVCGCVTAKLRRVTKMTSYGKNPKSGGMRKMSETGMNIARSMGRRLSTMLNIPVGYDMKEPNMMDNIPEAVDDTPPTKRRDSVTVTRVIYVDQ
ncbi:uncharacterized protein LOC128241281 [Mya arenaria]|uniref:uncharacterized protein LOC128241281 n=1 Tax=Mya arenaria TaxID=6604 RepID=UPI0022E4E4C7|nr:uncharacterized protein LOC128241281 [Mya arenaria]